MRRSRVLQILLLASGLLALGIGGALLLDPVGFEAGAGIELGRNASLLSEMRAQGGALLAGGVLIMTGAFVPAMTRASAVVAATVLLAYGLARVLGIMLDGTPSDTLLAATAVELGLGGATLGALFRSRQALPRSAATT